MASPWPVSSQRLQPVLDTIELYELETGDRDVVRKIMVYYGGYADTMSWPERAEATLRAAAAALLTLDGGQGLVEQAIDAEIRARADEVARHA